MRTDMYGGATVGVVVPAYDEGRLVGDVLDSIPPFVDRVYAVDDASTDNTWGEIRARAAAVRPPDRPGDAVEEPSVDDDGGPSAGGDAAPRVVGIGHATNRGRGGAVTTGYRHALADGMDVVAVLDGDGQMDPAILDRILDPVVAGEADYAKGTRLTRPGDRRTMSGWRLFGNALLTVLTRVSSGYWRMTDPQNGYTAISAGALRSLDLDGLYPEYGFLNDVLAKLNVAGLRVANVPMRAVYGDEQSGIRYRTFVPNVSVLLLRNFLWRLRADHSPATGYPLIALYLLGAATALGGAATLALVPLVVDPTPGPSLAGGALLVGVLASVAAATFDRRRNAPLEFTAGGFAEEETG
ncbi:MAG: glycosyltransferase family 2 protein [Haloferacaceae archaeon]